MNTGATRKDVYAAIDGEREYQAGHGAHRPLSLEGETMLVLEYAARLRRTYADTFGDPTERPTRDVLRKIAAICVRAMEHHGAALRETPANGA